MGAAHQFWDNCHGAKGGCAHHVLADFLHGVSGSALGQELHALFPNVTASNLASALTPWKWSRETWMKVGFAVFIAGVGLGILAFGATIPVALVGAEVLGGAMDAALLPLMIGTAIDLTTGITIMGIANGPWPPYGKNDG